MKKILYVVPILLAATGCLRENPLLKVDPMKLQSWIEYRISDIATPCAPFWADPDKASSSQLKSCEPTQQVIADKINAQGLTNEKVTAEDVLLPGVWTTFVAKQQRRAEADRRMAIYKQENKRCSRIRDLSAMQACFNKLRAAIHAQRDK